MATYSEKLKDPRWQRKRLEILQRDNFTCLICSAKDLELHVHHESYTKNPWETPDSDLKTLCCECHWLVENMTPEQLKRAMKFAERIVKNSSNG